MPPPETSIDSANGSEFAFSSDEPSSAFACSLDGGAFASCGSPRSFNGLTPGSHTFAVRATDANGATDPSPATRAFVVPAPPATTTVSPPDTTAPSVGSFSITPRKLHRKGKKTKGRVRSTVSESGRAAFTVRRCGRHACTKRVRSFSRTSGNGANSFSLNAKGLKPGKYQLVLVAADAAGNKAAAKRIAFTVLR